MNVHLEGLNLSRRKLCNTIYTVRTAQKTYTFSVIKTSQLMLYREIIAVCSEIHTNNRKYTCS